MNGVLVSVSDDAVSVEPSSPDTLKAVLETLVPGSLPRSSSLYVSSVVSMVSSPGAVAN